MSKGSAKSAFVKDLITLWPGLPYLGFGALSAWIFIAYSGTFWLSNTEVDGRYISHLYLLLMGVFAVIMLVIPFLPFKVQRHFEKTAFAYIGAALTGGGGLLVILAGPFYLAVSWLFYFGASISGVGTVFLTLRNGQLYGRLEPSKIVVYVVLSQLLVAALYFLFLGAEWFHPIAGGPSLSGIVALVVLPFFTAVLVSLPSHAKVQPPATEEHSQEQLSSIKQVPISFWKLCIAVFVFAIVTSVVRGYTTHLTAPDITLISSNSLMLLRMVFAVAFLYFTFRAVKRINFGKLYLMLMVGIAIAVTLATSMQLFGGAFALFVGFALEIFDILLWCMLAFIVYQSRVSFVVVFGLGRGVFMLGGVVGWMIGAWLLPLITSTVYISLLMVFLATLVLLCAILVFSEKDFDKLFSSIFESELTLEDLKPRAGQAGDLDGVLGSGVEHMRPYAQACKHVAKEARLTEREESIFELLAMGRGGESIAERLHISQNTVRTHTQNIYYKLDVHSRHELVALVESKKNDGVEPTI